MLQPPSLLSPIHRCGFKFVAAIRRFLPVTVRHLCHLFVSATLHLVSFGAFITVLQLPAFSPTKRFRFILWNGLLYCTPFNAHPKVSMLEDRGCGAYVSMLEDRGCSVYVSMLEDRKCGVYVSRQGVVCMCMLEGVVCMSLCLKTEGVVCMSLCLKTESVVCMSLDRGCGVYFSMLEDIGCGVYVSMLEDRGHN